MRTFEIYKSHTDLKTFNTVIGLTEKEDINNSGVDFSSDNYIIIVADLIDGIDDVSKVIMIRELKSMRHVEIAWFD